MNKSTENGRAASLAVAAGSAFSVPAFDGRVKEPLRRFAWWSWHPNYPYWSQSCWGGATIEEAMAEIELLIACGMDVYHNKLIREDDGGKLVEVADRPCKRPEVWERIAAAKRGPNK